MADDEENSELQEKVTDPSDEAAAAKLWSVYTLEADKYDKALVESWKSDMEGLLIFAALFSAILAAFIIESYKTLNSDSGDLTVQLLSQISQQLAASANGSTFNIPPTTPFTPQPASIVCNALWFISLGLSLTCALIATLVEQWARQFLHRADMRSAPLIRARVFSYLYYGLKRFHMHTVVEIIPLLLHASLLFFFGGLVAFLIPVNRTIWIITAAFLLVVIGVYTTLTLLPLRYLDCPYRTPLSASFWQIRQSFRRIWPRLSDALWQILHTCHQIFAHRHHGPSDSEAAGTMEEKEISSLSAHVELDPADKTADDSSSAKEETMVQAIFRTAGRSDWGRDHKSLVWTMKSLADDTELEPFVEAIPNLLWGPYSPREAYRKHLLRLVHDTDVRLDTRITGLFDSCRTGVLSDADRKRRLITCYKAFWAFASLPELVQSATESNDTVDFSHIYHRYTSIDSDAETAPYSASAKAVICWSTFWHMKGRIIAAQEALSSYAIETSQGGNPDLSGVASSVQDMHKKYFGFYPPSSLGPHHSSTTRR
ncbi:hypothetical protein B0H17DRAFT_510689 [Mycena rosella]|uniref:DUF6535 domain-containing protein n=1 Tax=Mycena rosella TaxID=1033263 RepID=A0AAD7DJG9_MYCRO|nr:hypothetical protein B0H17DRAFT_510689 [Mycena rosella]